MAIARRTRRRLPTLLIAAAAGAVVALVRHRALAQAEAEFRARHGAAPPAPGS